MKDSRLYIAVRNEVPSNMVPVLVAHTVINAHEYFLHCDLSDQYKDWFYNSFKKCVISVNDKEYNKIRMLEYVYEGYENSTLGGKNSCIITLPMKNEDLPNVLKFAKLWKPA